MRVQKIVFPSYTTVQIHLLATALKSVKCSDFFQFRVKCIQPIADRCRTLSSLTRANIEMKFELMHILESRKSSSHRVFVHFVDLGVIVTQCLGPQVAHLDASFAAAVCKSVALLWVKLCTGDDLQKHNYFLFPFTVVR